MRKGKALNFERLETRRLLAADLGYDIVQACNAGPMEPAMVAPEIAETGMQEVCVDPIGPDQGPTEEAAALEPAISLDLADGMDGYFGTLDAENQSDTLSFTANANGMVDIVVASSFGDQSTNLQVTDGEGNLVAASETEGLEGFSTLSFAAQADQTYELTVFSEDGGQGNFQVTIGLEAEAVEDEAPTTPEDVADEQPTDQGPVDEDCATEDEDAAPTDESDAEPGDDTIDVPADEEPTDQGPTEEDCDLENKDEPMDESETDPGDETTDVPADEEPTDQGPVDEDCVIEDEDTAPTDESDAEPGDDTIDVPADEEPTDQGPTEEDCVKEDEADTPTDESDAEPGDDTIDVPADEEPTDEGPTEDPVAEEPTDQGPVEDECAVDEDAGPTDDSDSEPGDETVDEPTEDPTASDDSETSDDDSDDTTDEEVDPTNESDDDSEVVDESDQPTDAGPGHEDEDDDQTTDDSADPTSDDDTTVDCSTDKPNPGDLHADEKGPEATEIPMVNGVGEVEGDLETVDDKDVFRFTASTSGEISLFAGEVSDENVDLDIKVYDSDGNLIVDGSTNEAVKVSFTAEADAEYFVSVESESDQKGTYEIRVEQDDKGPTDDHANEIGDDATLIETTDGEGNATGQLEEGADKDAFRVVAGGDGEIVVNLNVDSEDHQADAKVSIYADGQLIADGTTNESVGLRFDAAANVQYQVLVESVNENVMSYELSTREFPALAETSELATDNESEQDTDEGLADPETELAASEENEENATDEVFSEIGEELVTDLEEAIDASDKPLDFSDFQWAFSFDGDRFYSRFNGI